MEHKHTPGEWRVNTAGTGKNGVIVIDEIYVYAPGDNDDVAIASDIIDPATSEPSIANARLISAAPDLLETLQAIVNDGLSTSRIAAAKAAIAKATGEQ